MGGFTPFFNLRTVYMFPYTSKDASAFYTRVCWTWDPSDQTQPEASSAANHPPCPGGQILPGIAEVLPQGRYGCCRFPQVDCLIQIAIGLTAVHTRDTHSASKQRPQQ